MTFKDVARSLPFQAIWRTSCFRLGETFKIPPGLIFANVGKVATGSQAGIEWFANNLMISRAELLDSGAHMEPGGRIALMTNEDVDAAVMALLKVFRRKSCVYG